MDWLGDNLWAGWLIVAGALAGAELLSLDLVLLMLATGAVGGAVTALIGGPIAVQLLVALVTSLGMLFLVRPTVLKRLHGAPDLRTGVEAMLGQRATVLHELTADNAGRVKLGGEEWRALPYDETDRIEPGAVVEVVRVDGATAYVLRVPSLGS